MPSARCDWSRAQVRIWSLDSAATRWAPVPWAQQLREEGPMDLQIRQRRASLPLEEDLAITPVPWPQPLPGDSPTRSAPIQRKRPLAAEDANCFKTAHKAQRSPQESTF